MKTIFLSVVLLCYAVCVFAADDDKITICHVPPGNPNKAIPITISLSAWKVKNALGEAGKGVGECYNNPTGGDKDPEKKGHCPGGHGGDYVAVLPDQTCFNLKENRKATFEACKISNKVDAEERTSPNKPYTEEQARSACPIEGGGSSAQGKVHVCHVPPGRPDKYIDIDISCSAWKVCKSDGGKGFHCPGGHGGDFVASSCGGVPLGTPAYDTFCKPTKKICFVPDGGATQYQSKTIEESAWVESGPCDDGEFGPDCHGGDFEGDCPKVAKCPTGSILTWLGTAFKSESQCVCPSTAVGTCTQNGDNWDCNCRTCSREVTCSNLGDCSSDGFCICDPGSRADDGTCVIIPTTDPGTCDGTLFSGDYAGFQVVALGNAALSNGDVEGHLFVKDSFKVKNYAVGKGSDSGSDCSCVNTGDALYVGGTTSGSVDVCDGLYAYGATAGLGVKAPCGLLKSTRYTDFGTFALNARVISSRLSRYTPFTSYTGSKSTINLVSNGGPNQVFNIDSCSLNAAKNIAIDGDLSTAIFNIKGSCDVDIDEIGFDSVIINNAAENLWNFVNIKKIKIDNTELPGSVLAPVSTLTLATGGSINGQVIALELRGSGQFKLRDSTFVGCLRLASTLTNDGTCANGCPAGSVQDPTTCSCTCSNSCPGNQVQDSSSCQCYCPIADCGYGRQPSSDCSGCSKCSRSLPKGASWLKRGDCSDDNIIAAPACSSPKNIFGAASDFSIFITTGGYKSSNNRVGGRIAAYQDISLFNYLVGDDLDTDSCTGDRGPWSLVSGSGSVIFPGNGQVLGGSIADNFNGVSVGSAILNGLTSGCNYDKFSETSVVFDSKFFVSLSEDLKDLKSSKDVNIADNQKKSANVWEFTGKTGSDKGNVDVFNVPNGENLASTGFWELNNVDSGATIVVNIGGENPGFKNMDLSPWKKFATRVVFNFYEAKSVTITGVAVPGSILAPHAVIIASNGQVRGQIIGSSWDPTGSIYVPWHGGFEGCLDL